MTRIDHAIYERFVDDLRQEFGDDDQLIADMLEGETDFDDVVGKLLKADAEAAAHEDAQRALSRTYADQAARSKDRREALRGKLSALLRSVDLRAYRHAFGTVSVKPVPPAVRLSVDASELPQEFQRVTVAVDKTALKDALNAGRDIPGATLSNGGETISIRRA